VATHLRGSLKGRVRRVWRWPPFPQPTAGPSDASLYQASPETLGEFAAVGSLRVPPSTLFPRSADGSSGCSVLSELKERGVRDILVCCVVDGLPEAIEALFPHGSV